MSDTNETTQPTPTPCPECQSERVLAEAGNNVRVVGRASGLRGAVSAYSELWAMVCPHCGYTTFYAKKPGKITT